MVSMSMPLPRSICDAISAIYSAHIASTTSTTNTTTTVVDGVYMENIREPPSIQKIERPLVQNLEYGAGHLLYHTETLFFGEKSECFLLSIEGVERRLFLYIERVERRLIVQ